MPSVKKRCAMRMQWPEKTSEKKRSQSGERPHTRSRYWKEASPSCSRQPDAHVWQEDGRIALQHRHGVTQRRKRLGEVAHQLELRRHAADGESEARAAGRLERLADEHLGHAQRNLQLRVGELLNVQLRRTQQLIGGRAQPSHLGDQAAHVDDRDLHFHCLANVPGRLARILANRSRKLHDFPGSWALSSRVRSQKMRNRAHNTGPLLAVRMILRAHIDPLADTIPRRGPAPRLRRRTPARSGRAHGGERPADPERAARPASGVRGSLRHAPALRPRCADPLGATRRRTDVGTATPLPARSPHAGQA